MAPAQVNSLDDIRALARGLPGADETARRAAAARQAVLTKPVGALGRLEDLAVWLAGWQGRTVPELARVHVVVFAGNHGIAARGVSAYPSEVTAQMVANFEAGGAAINQLCRIAEADLAVIPLAGLKASADFTTAPALNELEFLAAFNAGLAALPDDTDLIAVGEMGIANTTAAAALAAALFGEAPANWVGPGTGIDAAGLARKTEAVAAGLRRHCEALADPLQVLRRLGGHELTAICGLVLAARRARVPVLLDGYVACAAAAPLARLAPDGLSHVQAAHRSAEPAHGRLLAALGLDALLDLGMRLGEASGAALAIPVLRAAIACHGGMATFETAGVSGPA